MASTHTFHENFRSLPRVAVGLAVASMLVLFAGCSSSSDEAQRIDTRPMIVASNVVLGSVVSEIVGPVARVVVLVPNGVDPHVYEPSAKDIEQLSAARLVVVNGLGLEERLERSLARVRASQIQIFEATDHIDVHEMEEQGSQEHAGDQHSDDDPHFWTDPRQMAEVVDELGKVIEDLGLDVGDRARMFSERLLTFDQEMLNLIEGLPEERRILVTGHESLGYFAERYGFEIVGTIIPGLTTEAEVSAANLSDVKMAIQRTGVGVIFTELGTSADSARLLSKELGVEVVEISSHVFPDKVLAAGLSGDSYISFIEMLVETIVAALAK